MSQASGKLAAVPSPQDESSSASAAPPASSRRRSSLGYWILALLLAIALLIVVFQTNRVGELSGRVEGLETELSSTRAALSRYEGRFDQIRASVGELQSQLSELETLVEEPPAGTP